MPTSAEIDRKKGLPMKKNMTILNMFHAFKIAQSGAVAVEYALIAAATSLALVSTLPTIKTNLGAMYNAILGYFA